MPTPAIAPVDQATIEALTDRMFTLGVGAIELGNIYLGHTLGFYRALADGGRTAATLAAGTDCDEVYVREWLQAQVVSGFVIADNPDLKVATCTLAPGVREVLVDEVSPAYMAPFGQFLAAVGVALPSLVDAFQTGDGVAYADYGPDAVAGQAAFNRPAFVYQLAAEWIPALPDVAARLADTAHPALVADLACGVGWAGIELAKAFPHIRVDGYDADEASIAAAQQNAAAHGVADRVHFEIRDLSEADPDDRQYDFVMFFEALHDMPYPEAVLRASHELMAPGGTLLVMEERANDSLAPTEDQVQRFLANISPLWCLPQGRIDEGAHPVGTLIREETVHRLLREAGWRDVRTTEIDHPIWRFIRAAA
jgi:2-polyprenyl-3-methyl-5-hydroxy-6-metoxy-1,4-benzoquinol methylase